MTSVWVPVLGAVTALASAAVVYPYLIYPWFLGRLKPKPFNAPSEPAGSDSFALLFCAFNEAAVAAEKLENLIAVKARNPGIEILVFDDGSTDGCDEIFGSRPDILRLVRGAGRAGKAQGMKRLVATTDREFVVFTDANVMLEPEAIGALARHFSDASVGGVCGHLAYQERHGTATEMTGGRYWSLEERLKGLESRSGNVMGGDGSIFAVRRGLYPEFPDTVQDDFTVTMSVVFAGQRLIYAPDVVARENLVSIGSEEYRRKVRIAARAHHTHLAMLPSLKQMGRLDRWKYWSHKIVRWYGGGFAGLAVATAILLLALLSPIVAAGATVMGILVLFGLSRISSRGGMLLEVCSALAATMHGVLLARRGKTFATWAPPVSR